MSDKAILIDLLVRTVFQLALVAVLCLYMIDVLAFNTAALITLTVIGVEVLDDE